MKIIGQSQACFMMQLVRAMFFPFVVQVEAHKDTLVNEQASYVLTKAGLMQIYSIAQQHQPQEVSVRL